MRRALFAPACLLAVALAPPDGARASEPPLQRPFLTLLPWSLDRGEWEVATGLVRREGAQPPFFPGDRDLRRDEWRLGLVDVTLGLGGGGEARLQFGLQRFEEDAGLKKSGVEDARISFTYQLPFPSRLPSRSSKGPTSALSFAVKLPDAPNDQRLGTDEADIFLMGAMGQARARWGWAGNLGLGILGNPLDAGVQDDVLILGAAGWWAPGKLSAPGSLVVLAEVSGAAASRFGNDVRTARAGVRLGTRFPFDLSLRKGLTSESEDWGAEIGWTILHPALPH